MNILTNRLIKDEYFENLMKIADNYGLKKQLRQLAEECSELSVEASHSARRGTTIKLIEEVADVLIMITQVVNLANISEDDIKENIKYKINSQLRRIKKGE